MCPIAIEIGSLHSLSISLAHGARRFSLLLVLMNHETLREGLSYSVTAYYWLLKALILRRLSAAISPYWKKPGSSSFSSAELWGPIRLGNRSDPSFTSLVAQQDIWIELDPLLLDLHVVYSSTRVKTRTRREFTIDRVSTLSLFVIILLCRNTWKT